MHLPGRAQDVKSQVRFTLSGDGSISSFAARCIRNSSADGESADLGKEVVEPCNLFRGLDQTCQAQVLHNLPIKVFPLNDLHCVVARVKSHKRDVRDFLLWLWLRYLA